MGNLIVKYIVQRLYGDRRVEPVAIVGTSADGHPLYRELTRHRITKTWKVRFEKWPAKEYRGAVFETERDAQAEVLDQLYIIEKKLAKRIKREERKYNDTV